jgi:hypothetical protein
MKRPSNVHKFKLALVLVGVLLVGVIGYTLWFVNHSEKVANDAYAKSGNSYTVKPTKKVASAQPAQTQQYLTIKEWGVKVSINDPALTEAIYKAPKALINLESGVESVTLATKDTASMDFTCGGAGTGEPITHSTGDDQDALLRAKTPTILSTASNNSPSTFAHIGSYYYVYQHNTGHGACGITNSTLAAEARAASNAFAKSSIVAE